jgi:molybdenum cofactor cytidylyltransferase
MAPGSSNIYISALFLAAGRGERMGGVKQLLPLKGQRMVEASLHNLLASQVHEIIVVLGFAADEIRPFVVGKERVKVVINPRFPEGMSSSIRAGMQALDPRCTGVLIALADQPFIPAEVIDQLIEGFAAGGKGIVLPVYAGAHGHPVILQRATYEKELLALQGDVGGKAIVRNHPEDVLEVEVASKGVVVDIDEPTDYQKIERES